MRFLRSLRDWLFTQVNRLRWFGVEDEISFQGVEYDEDTGELRRSL